jgi:hypothetical protein
MGLISLLVQVVIGGIRGASSDADPQEAKNLEASLRDKKQPLDPKFEQLVGRRCRGCKEEIAIQKEATRCPSCNKPIHVRCLDRHIVPCSVPKTEYR